MKLLIMGKFSSRRNIVHLARAENGQLVIHKQYRNILGMQKEAEVLRRFSLCGYAPMVLEQGKDYLINEYIDGDLFFDRYRLATMMDDQEQLNNLAAQLSVFLQIFYSMFDGHILGEINFKNFILRDNRCYGIDYENVSEGMQYLDVADIVANALLHAAGEPISALPFVARILRDFHLDTMDIVNDVKLALERIAESSGAPYDINYLLNILMYYNDNQGRYSKEGRI